MLRCVTARAGSVLDDGPLLAEKQRKPQSSNSSRSSLNPHAPQQGVNDTTSPHDSAMSKPAGAYKPPMNPTALAITASSVPAPPPAPPVQVPRAVHGHTRAAELYSQGRATTQKPQRLVLVHDCAS